jgi:exoribonuclease-2
MSDFDGRIWAIHDGDYLQLVCQSKVVKNKVHVLNAKNREQSFKADRLLISHPHTVNSASEWVPQLEKLYRELASLQKDIDMDLLWESAEALETTDLGDLAELYFGADNDKRHHIALWQAMAKDGLHFKRKGKIWELRSAEQITELRTQRQREAEKAAFLALAKPWLANASQGNSALTVDEDHAPIAQRLESWMQGDNDKELFALLEPIADQQRIKPRELGFDILQRCGLIAADADRDIIVAGLKINFSQTIEDAVDALSAWQAPENQSVKQLAFSIDDDDTREIDDALDIQREDDGWRVRIGIANPANLVTKDDILDKEAMRRGTTVYLPTQNILMMPSRLSCDLSSLNADIVRAAIVVNVKFSEDGEILDSKIESEAVQVTHRLSYDQADQMLDSGEDDTAQQLRDLRKLTDALHQQRMDNGALSFNRPEYKIKVQDGNISIEMLERNSPSRQLVAELMIIANHLVAKYAQTHEVPIIYRTQEAPAEKINNDDLTDPLAFQKIRKLLKPSSLSLQPSGHSGLGLSVYAQFSSPLRRFADLVIQRQINAHLNGEESPYDEEELFQVLATSEQTARAAKGLENESKRRWFVAYLKQHQMKKDLQVRVLGTLKIGYKAEMLPWGVEAFMSGEKNIEVGSIITAEIEKLRPKSGQIKLRAKSVKTTE